jgi:uncharacterized protein (DUF4415 family)
MKKSNTSKKSGTDSKRLEPMRDEDIDFSDIPELTPEMFRYKVVGNKMFTEPRDEITLRMDRDLVQWDQSRGDGWERLINFLLRSYMQETERKWAKSEKPKARRA